jgi:hypothetical protein
VPPLIKISGSVTVYILTIEKITESTVAALRGSEVREFQNGELPAIAALCISKGRVSSLYRFEFSLFFRFRLLPPKPVAIRKVYDLLYLFDFYSIFEFRNFVTVYIRFDPFRIYEEYLFPVC